jgi:DNA-binding CsgD family transcriptional regulator
MNDETTQPRRRLHDVGRQARRQRIFERIRRGLSYDEIAQKEGLSGRHVRRIVARALNEREAHAGADHAKLQLDRLGLALLIVSKALAAGERRAVAPFLKALDRLDRYHKLARGHQDENEDVKRKLIAKLNFMARNLGYDEEPVADRAGQEA